MSIKCWICGYDMAWDTDDFICCVCNKEKENEMGMQIIIKKSPTADTRTCDWSTVTKQELLDSSESHIGDVKLAMNFFSDKIRKAGHYHDFTKVSHIADFHFDFQTGFKTQNWFEMHKVAERHHINYPEGVRKDVNLVDVLEHIADCVMAGMARSGSVYDLELPNEILQAAFKNTVEMLKEVVRVE